MKIKQSKEIKDGKEWELIEIYLDPHAQPSVSIEASEVNGKLVVNMKNDKDVYLAVDKAK